MEIAIRITSSSYLFYCYKLYCLLHYCPQKELPSALHLICVCEFEAKVSHLARYNRVIELLPLWIGILRTPERRLYFAGLPSTTVKIVPSNYLL